MRVVALVHAHLPYHLAGSEVMMQALLAELVSRGHEAHIIVTKQDSGPDTYQHEGVTVHKHTDDLIETLNPDIVISHHAEAVQAGQWAHSTQTPLVLVLNDTFPGNLSAIRILRPDLLVVNSRWVHRSLPSKRSKTITVHPPVDVGRHKTEPGSKITLVNLSENKGANLFYELATCLPQHQFLGILGAYGKQVIRSMPNVEIRPTTPDPETIWADTRILLMPSKYESYGLVGLEAACSGIPTIATPTIGLLESLSYAGTFVDRDDVDGWVNAITALCGPAWGAASQLATHRVNTLNDAEELTMWATACEDLL